MVTALETTLTSFLLVHVREIVMVTTNANRGSFVLSATAMNRFLVVLEPGNDARITVMTQVRFRFPLLFNQLLVRD